MSTGTDSSFDPDVFMNTAQEGAHETVFHPVPQDIDFGPLEDLFREEVFKVFLKQEKITE